MKDSLKYMVEVWKGELYVYEWEITKKRWVRVERYDYGGDFLIYNSVPYEERALLDKDIHFKSRQCSEVKKLRNKILHKKHEEYEQKVKELPFGGTGQGQLWDQMVEEATVEAWEIIQKVFKETTIDNYQIHFRSGKIAKGIEQAANF